MRAYAALGNRAGVTRQFERCRQVLLEDASAPLSVEIERFMTDLCAAEVASS